ncbi:E3 ubiquitin-protein ligase PDZRN3-like isoform X2 [Antedon mediterranea]|uniref:E3 ubiquitin-protein ligase PDZRN3-like isoform X2 n=1 Tax=Antedon mediterranea TaxID=105859 RepID=UPI003AF9CE7B
MNIKLKLTTLLKLCHFKRYDMPCTEEKEINLILERDDGSLGFNIIGGNGAEGGITDGIIVSRVTESGPAEQAELKIHDRIIKVNGQDLTKSSHEEAVEAFKNASEPIVVQVLRRTSRTKGKDDKEPLHCNAGTQTDLQSEDLLWRVLQRCPTPPPAPSDVSLEGLCDLPSPEPLTSFDGDLMNDLYAMDNLDMPIIDDSMEKTFEMEYEDVVLKRSNTTEKLGLTLCYGEEDDTGIFINEVDSNGVAAKEGSIRIGDQILQINGEDVLNKDQALSLFAKPAEELTLLVCRPQLQYDEFLFDDNNSLLDDLQLDMLERTHQEAMQFTACLLDAECHQDDDALTTDTGTTENTSTGNASTHKDSGVGHATDESVRNDSEQEGAGDGLSNQLADRIRNGELRCSTDSFMSNEQDIVHEISLSECLKFREQLSNKCDKHMRSDTDSESLRGKESKVMRLGSDSMETTSVSGEDTLNRNGQWMGMAHDSQVSVISQDVQDSIWAKQDSSNTQSMESVDSAGNSKDKSTPEPPVATGSGDETEIKPDGPVELSLKLKTLQNGKADTTAHMSLVDKSTKKPLLSGRHRSRLPKTNPSSPRKSSSSSSRDRSSSKEKSTASPAKEKVKTTSQQKSHHQRMPATNPRLRAQLSQRTPYFARIQEQAQYLHTKNSFLQKENIQLRRSLESLSSITSIPNYAKHYRSYMHLVKKNEEKAYLEDKEKDSKQESQPEMKWKVKIRSDGTRYIARRPVRDKILKERENKLQDERAGLTTDDEAMSEMKLGRYWNREDRKRHVERAKDQRRRREFMVQARMEALKEQGNEENKKQDIFDLSRKKMNKKKAKGGWDDFMTVEEMLAHGIRISPSNSKEFNPLLNVTTV